MTYYAPLVSASVTLLLTLFFTTSKAGIFVQDIPNERSLHDKPIPRVGGVALLIGVMFGWGLLFEPAVFASWVCWIVLPTLGLFALSLADDLCNLSPRIRLIGHFIAALLAVSSIGLALPWFVPALLFVVWMTNLYNFMDGSDGLAGGMALFGFGSYGLGAWLAGDGAFALLNSSVAAAALGFLCFNFHPARIFMGDAGSIPLGFMAAIFGIWGWQQSYWPFWFPLLVFSPFVADATVTLFKRAYRGEKLSSAHCSHYYQRLVQMGFGHRNTALAEYVLMLLAGASALWGIGLRPAAQSGLLLGWSIVYFALMWRVDMYWHEFKIAAKKVADV